jgi:hypothetical protein
MCTVFVVQVGQVHTKTGCDVQSAGDGSMKAAFYLAHVLTVNFSKTYIQIANWSDSPELNFNICIKFYCLGIFRRVF